VTTVEVFAPAKVNLTLHVTGRRDDGYHLLDTLVVFADVGDRVTLKAQGTGALRVEGPEAGSVPVSADNLIARQAAAMPAFVRRIDTTLHKALPVASGIGGGSADAAAFYRGAAALAPAAERAEFLSPDRIAAQWTIGADVPMCIHARPLRAQGIGSTLTFIDDLPQFSGVLVNPRVAVPTAAVFKELRRKANAPMSAMPRPDREEEAGLLDWLSRQRNDLEEPAVHLVPEIAGVLSALAARTGCRVARMSGSGATCFGLFATREAARCAARRLSEAHPGWWVRDTTFDGHVKAVPQVMRSTT
jgi:4-diphosphocytidyl-2-C-methyl-D-erythritol kinase